MKALTKALAENDNLLDGKLDRQKLGIIGGASGALVELSLGYKSVAKPKKSKTTTC